MKRLTLVVCALLAACTGETINPGVDEPLLVDKGTLHAGNLAPPPVVDDAATDDASTDATGTDSTSAPAKLEVTSIELPTGVAGVGESRTVSGRVAEAAYAIAVQLAGDATAAYGSGYWVVPIDGVDPQYPGERTWTFGATIGHNAPAGMAKIRIAPVAADGTLAETRDVNLCISPDYPDNLNACDPTIQPPAFVVQLHWDRDVDLDLSVVRPDGTELSNKASQAADKTTLLPGKLDTDSLAACKGDPRRTENAVWQEKPTKGLYTVRARLFSACSQASVRFVARALLRQAGEKSGTWTQVEVARWTGTLLAAQVDGGANLPLTVGNIELP